jgi:fumarate reductase subunit D
MKRSNAPIFWLLFGAGGMLAALLGAALAFVSGIALPTGVFPSSSLLDFDRALALARSVLGKGFLLAVVVLFLWHAAHRIYHTLHDLGVHALAAARIGCYGTALAGSVAAVIALWSIGF